MNRRLLMISVIAGCAGLLFGCGRKKESLIRYGLVTGPEGTSGSAELTDISSGIDTYAAENAFSTRIYTASADTKEGYSVQFDAAAEDGTAYVISVGESMEVPVYNAQNANHDQHYLLFDGEPRASGDMESTIRSNTECVTFSRTGIGFLAGYAAVCSGNRNLVYMSGNNEGDTADYYRGFLGGVDYALAEQGISAGSISIGVEFVGSDGISPRRMADAAARYDGGTELILTDSPGIAKAVEKAAEEHGGSVATIGFDDMSSSSSVRFSVVPDWESAVMYLLDQFENHSGFSGGESLMLGAAEHAIRMNADYAALGSFSEASCQSVLELMGNGSASVPASLKEAAEQSGNGGTELQISFQVNEVEPLPGNANSGLDEQTASQTSSDGSSDAGSDGSSDAGSGESDIGT